MTCDEGACAIKGRLLRSGVGLELRRSGRLRSPPAQRQGIIPLTLFLLSFVLGLSGCISISRTSTGDFGYDERLASAISDIESESRNAAKAIKARNADTDPIDDVTLRHFEMADEIALSHAVTVKQSLPFVSLDPYIEKREKLLEFTTGIDGALTLLSSSDEAAMAFPHGEVFATKSLVELFDRPAEGYNSALLGLFLHELIHIRDGHAVEQWATADGRNELVKNTIIGALSNVSILIPFLSIDYDMKYGFSFKSSEKLGELSEYAADFGALTLLRDSGFDQIEYINFLEDTHRFAASRQIELNEPFSWMEGRLECLHAAMNVNAESQYPSVVIGSHEEGDEIVYTLDRQPIDELLRELSDPAALRHRLFPYGGGDEATDDEVREAVVRGARLNTFVRCAALKVFGDGKSTNDVLHVPSFDLLMFFQYG